MHKTRKAAAAVGFSDGLANALKLGAVHSDALYTGKSAAPVVGDLSWHFDTNPDPSVDLRLANFEESLEAAVFLLERGWEKAAFYVLGYGIHALQDFFAHGDSTPLDHVWAVVIGTMQKEGQTGKLELWSWMDAADMDGPNTPAQGGESQRAQTAKEVTTAILQGFRDLWQSIRGLFRD